MTIGVLSKRVYYDASSSKKEQARRPAPVYNVAPENAFIGGLNQTENA
jgi:hypothetical protein